MAQRSHTEGCRPGDTLVVVHEFIARSPDELSLRRGDRIELIERDDDFGDGWFLGKNTETGDNGLFPEVYTRPAPKPTPIPTMLSRNPSQLSVPSDQLSGPPGMAISEPQTSQPPPSSSSAPPPLKSAPTEPLNIAQGPDVARRTSVQSGPRSISMTLSGEVPHEDETIGSPVMHETLSVIDEHITGMNTPRHGAVGKELRANDSESEYSSHHRLSYINGQETDEEEEQNWHTEEEVKTWSPARVAEYLEDVGVEQKHCHVFRDQDIDGEALLGVDRNFIFMQEFDLGPMGPRLRTWMKINALQSEVKNAKEAAKATLSLPSLQGHDEFPIDGGRNRAASIGAVLPRIPTLRESVGSRGSTSTSTSTTRQHIPRAASSAGRSSAIEATSPLIQHTPASPSLALGSPVRPSAASIRSMNHNRRHSSIDYNQGPPTPSTPSLMKSPTSASTTSHRKTPSFDRNWTMGSTARLTQELKRPVSSHHIHTSSTNGTSFDAAEPGLTAPAEVDRGYFSGGEVDNRKNRNVLRKKESPSHSRNASYSTEAGRRMSYGRRHSRIGSADSALPPASPVSAAAKQYYGTHTKAERSSSAFDFVRPLKPQTDSHPTVTKLAYDSHSIDAIANSPAIPGSETSSTGRASPSPAAPSHTRSFFSSRKGSQSRGLRAISDAITGGERANASAADVTTPHKDSPMQSPSRTGSSTPSGTSLSKSFELEKADANRRFTAGSTGTKEGRKKTKKHGTSAYLKGRQQITPQQAMENCDYSGWMKKKSSSLMTTWKTRLFVLRGRRLAYYYTENDTEEKGLIDISSHRVLPANDERMTGLHASLTGAASSPVSPQNATIQTTASADSAKGIPGMDGVVEGMFIFKLVPPRAGLQKGVQFTKPIVHYFAVDSLAVGRLWMAALMKATIDRDEALPFTTTYQQKTISLEKARAMRQRPPNLMDEDLENGSADAEKKSEYSKESLQESTIHEEDEKGLAISGLDDAKALLAYADSSDIHPEHPHDGAATAITT